jgi:hypothetical protein
MPEVTHAYMLNLLHQQKHAIMRNRNRNSEGPARDAFEDLRDWMIDEMEPALERLLTKAIRDTASSYGVREGQLITMLQRPPAGETRPELLRYMYSLLV